MLVGIFNLIVLLTKDYVIEANVANKKVKRDNHESR